MPVIITTSRSPSRRTRSLVKDLALVIPKSIKVNRGKTTLEDLRTLMLSYRVNGVIVVYERKGNPSALLYYVGRDNELKRRFLIKLRSVKLRREIAGSQKPINVSCLTIDQDTMLSELLEVFTEIFNIADYESGKLFNSLECIKAEFKPCLDGQYINLRFICLGSNRICGPLLTIEKVIRYEV